MSSAKSPLPSFPWREVTPQPIIGVDEVGRGCLAGPVYAAAVVLDETQNLDKLTDSKLLRPKVRETVAGEIHQYHQVGIGWASIEEIDQYNILNAALLAMKRAVLKLGLKGGHILVDGNKEIPDLENFVQTTVIKGDLRAAPISAASIVAKVARDQLMADFSEQYPGYGFEKHKGYSTKEHKFSIEQKGPCNIHRRSFSGVKEFL